MKRLNNQIKRIVLRVVVVLIFLSMAMFLNGQETEKMIYRDYGTWMVPHDGNKVGFSAFSTVESITKTVPKNIEQLNTFAQKKSNQPEFEKNVVYKYELYLTSKSVYEGDSTGTWIYGTRVFINDVELSKKNYPNGFMVYVDTIPTLVYWYELPKRLDYEFTIKWESAVYEPRILK